MIPPIDVLNLRKKLIRQPFEHKGSGGRIVIIGGQNGMTGALTLAGIGALYSGAGWVELGFLANPYPLLISEHPELMIHRAKNIKMNDADVIAIGPGMGVDSEAKSLVQQALLSSQTLVLDADALNLISQNSELLELLKNRSADSVLTPHPGEAARLLNLSTADIQAEREKSIRAPIEKTQAIVVLKGSGTLCGSPHNPTEICLRGNSGMGSGGMGDTLTGIIAALIAQGAKRGINTWDATRLGVEIHALAADQLVLGNNNLGHPLGPIGLTASEVALEVRHILNSTEKL